ncbi:MAG: 1-acyl-sn-glycerol-3-phosphate acyltransferase [Clostridia bacterium]|nr:1-acyl-sn-glycerol-3-phosphate acyltransferase [Clostridia bacterium]
MKIKHRALSYDKVLALPPEKHEKPLRPSRFVRALLRTLSAGELRDVGFTFDAEGMERLGKDQPALFLMNHSSFIDLKIASVMLYPRPFNIICTSDGFVGKKQLMRHLGCIPTRKFIPDVTLVKDMVVAVKELGNSLLMYPEASYSFDGTATPLPRSLGKLLKLLGIPVVMIKTSGAFLRDPLYNMLQVRKVPVSAHMRYVLSPEDIAQKSVEQLNEILRELFTFDYFREQQQNGIRVTEPFRADGLNRVLYKCPACLTEGQMEGKGIRLRCGCCGKTWELTEQGVLKAEEGEDTFPHIPDWYAWERDCVRKEWEAGTYSLDIPVTIRMLVDSKCLYTVGEGRLTHTKEGLHLTGCDGKLDYLHKPALSYSLYSDYYWYELGDMICIGNSKALYYCFPKEGGDVVAKTRLAAEEYYRMRFPAKHEKDS